MNTNQPSHNTRKAIRWVLTGLLFLLGIAGTLLFLGCGLLEMSVAEEPPDARMKGVAFCGFMFLTFIGCLAWAIRRAEKLAGENEAQAPTDSSNQLPSDKPRLGSLTLLIVSVFYSSAVAGIVAYWILALYQHRTNPGFAGESMDNAEAFISLAAGYLGFLILITNFIPALILRLRRNRRRDRLSLKLSVISLIVLALLFGGMILGIR